MIMFVNDNIFDSPAEVLVNTVNLDGYMGKGLAYQFKHRFPENNKSYMAACKKKEIGIGKIHVHRENNKIIINFPTKNRWREKSRIEYIEQGLDDLKRFIDEYKVTSIAIPPLGSGNGGLNWDDVKQLILDKLKPIEENIDIYIYEPGVHGSTIISIKPQLSLSSLVLVYIKRHLNKKLQNRLVLQKTAFFMDCKLKSPYFRFKADKFGPYDDVIRIISTQIAEYKQFFNIQSTEKLYDAIKLEIMSDRILRRFAELKPSLNKAIHFINDINDRHMIEAVGTIMYIVQTKQIANEQDIIDGFSEWSVQKRARFTDDEIALGIQLLVDSNYVQKTLMGYTINNQLN
ncbi:type II toxin-antitoxin system antitoxin DNA ADP-ribosyl glycohydrolase DarG [Veillonella agrestimuris]|uniref:type II toxin-antitoxin system antitoxin DNA ADP-ribosyl glycohydrolase DarG n=1 Tax=Veillonella agrestimuris TaxID=2941340 RepID=UPI002040062E|nr:macro domain-containing protein [Veillonella agrestimuris]